MAEPGDSGNDEKGWRPQYARTHGHEIPNVSRYCALVDPTRAGFPTPEAVHPDVLVFEGQVTIEHRRAQLYVMMQRVADDDASVRLRQEDQARGVRGGEQSADGRDHLSRAAFDEGAQC